MKDAKSVYWKALIAAIVLYVIATCYFQFDLYYKLSDVEHAVMHGADGGCMFMHH